MDLDMFNDISIQNPLPCIMIKGRFFPNRQPLRHVNENSPQNVRVRRTTTVFEET
jgi:hypothetical protein